MYHGLIRYFVLPEEIQAKITIGIYNYYIKISSNKLIILLLNLLGWIHKKTHDRNSSMETAEKQTVNLRKLDPTTGTGYRPKADRR